MAPTITFRTRSPRKAAVESPSRMLVASPDATGVYWKHNDCVISVDEPRIRQRTLPGGVFVLDILKVVVQDEGRFEAILLSDEGGDAVHVEFDIELVVFPETWCCHLIRGLPSHLQLTRGADAVLRTRFLANPEPTFVWLQDGLVVMSSATDRLSAPKAPPQQQHHHLQDKCGHVRTVTDADSSELHLVAVGGHRRATGVNSGAKGAGGIGGGVSGGGVPSSSATSGRSHICAVVENEFGCDYRSVELLVSDLNEKVRVDELEKFAAQYALDEQIGAGRFGTVYQCVDKSTGGQVAAKIIKTITSKEILAVEREVEVLNQFRAHPKLLTLLGVYRGPKEMILVTEFVAGGELFERVVAEDFYLTEQDCVAFVRQILDAMQFVHSQNVLHLDLKPENILCTDATGHNIKIIDFGLAQHYDPSEDLKVLFGTPEFVAPEVISYEAVSPKSDMWSIGVITYVLLTGLSPFMGDTNDQTYQNVISVDYEFDPDAFEDISEEAIAFVSRLLVRDPTSRPSCAECLSDPWLSGSPGNPPLRQMPIDTQKLKSFVVRRKWLKGANVICALNRLGVFSGRSNSARLRVDLPGKQ